MNKITKSFILSGAAAAMIALVGCGGGGGGGNYSTGGTYYTHDELAQEFVRRVNVDVAGYDLTLVKSTTLQYDYIVVYDSDYGSYDAYYIGNYNVGQDLNSYLYNNQAYFYFDLVPETGNTYYDPVTGTRFQKQNSSDQKNLAKMKALKQDLAIQKSADSLRAQYGLSAEKSVDVARFAYKMKSAPAGTYNKADYDAFAKELTGSTISDFQKDLKNGDDNSLNARIQKAAQETGMGPEGVNKLIGDMFAGSSAQ
jgi:hypothetical protein